MAYHFIGIGGIGMSALAQILLEQDIPVSGSDGTISARTKQLQVKGATIFEGQKEGQVPAGAQVVVSSAVNDLNPEVIDAKRNKNNIIHRSKLLAELTQGAMGLAVAGTHGKTTVSSMLAWTLLQAGYDPSFAVGGILPKIATNGRHGAGPHFVYEADESDGTFVCYHPFGAIITNVEADHLDTYAGDIEQIYTHFWQFIGQIASPDHLVWCGDDPWLKSQRLPGISYGFASHNSITADKVEQNGFSQQFDVAGLGRCTLPMPGKHNVLNALAVIALCLKLGLGGDQIRQGLATFPGVGRRCERIGERDGVLFVDDYAHHPTEVKATLAALKGCANRLVALFQPHRYSRVRDFWPQFVEAFADADLAIVTDVYAAGETQPEGFDIKAVANQISNSIYLPYNQLLTDLPLQQGDLLVTLGAGSITTVGRVLYER